MNRYDDNHYGKGCVKVAKVIKHPKYHDFKEFVVGIQLYGDFLDAYVVPTNKNVIPTDTMKNTVFVLAKQHPMNNAVEFGIDTSNYFLNKFSHVSKVRVDITEVVWNRVVLENNKEHTHGFVDKQTHNHVCVVENDRTNIDVKAGIVNLSILKTKGSAFTDYLVDEYTTLKPAKDRIMATKANLFWKYDNVFDLKTIDHNQIYKKVKQLSVETFVSHDDSESVQHTIHLLGNRALNLITEMQTIEINLPNSHYLLSNIADFGFQNDNEIFVPAPEPYGNIFAKMSKTEYAVRCFNKLSNDEAIEVIKDISQSKKFQNLLVNGRPYTSVEDILSKLNEIYLKLNNQDFNEIISSCTRLGDKFINKKLTYIKEEFVNVIENPLVTQKKIDELIEYNKKYEAKFNHIFILAVAGKSLDDIISTLKIRINNDAQTEFNTCIDERKKIEKMRIPQVLKAFGQNKLNKENKINSKL